MIQVHCLFIQAAKYYNLVGSFRILDFYKHTNHLFIVLDQGKQDEENTCDQIKEKIAKRKGTTSIVSFESIELCKKKSNISITAFCYQQRR
jgi:hypothetical protein